MPHLSVLFFGMEGVFSRAPLAALLDAGYDVRAVVVPRSYALPGSDPIPRLRIPPRQHGLTLQLVGQPTEPSIVGMAWARRIPVLEIPRPSHPDTLAALAAYAPDVVCVACFPYLLPQALLTMPRYGGFNVHPSLLPAYRGPSPLFWVYHAGLEHAGVTVHQMDAGADTGAVAAQQPAPLPDGTRYGDAEGILSRVGGDLLVNVLDDIVSGRLRLRPQLTTDAPRAPTPNDDAFIIETTWSARRAFNFIRGVSEWGRPFTIQTQNGALVVRDAATFDPARTALAPLTREGSQIAVGFSPGVVYFEPTAIEDYPPG